MEFLFIIVLAAFAGRKYKIEKGVKPVKLNPNRYHEENVFMVMYDTVMKEGRIK